MNAERNAIIEECIEAVRDRQCLENHDLIERIIADLRALKDKP